VLSSHVVLLFVGNILSWTCKFAKSSCRIWASGMYGTKERCTQVLAGRLEGMRPLGRPSDRLEDNIKMALQEVGWEGIYWIDLAYNRDRWWALVNVVVNLRVAKNVGNLLTG